MGQREHSIPEVKAFTTIGGRGLTVIEHKSRKSNRQFSSVVGRK